MRCQNRHITLTLNASTCRGVRGLISKHLLPIDDCDAKLDRSEFAIIIISIPPEYGPFRLEDCQSFCWWNLERVVFLPYSSSSSSLDSFPKATVCVPDTF